MSTHSITTATHGSRIALEVPDDPGDFSPIICMRLNTSAGETHVDLSVSDVIALRDLFGEVYIQIRSRRGEK